MSALLDKLRARVKEKIEKKAEKGKGFGLYSLPEKVEFFRPQKAGTYNIDILPYKVTAQNHPQVSAGEIWFERTVFVHFKIGDEELAYICPKTIGKKCPICEQRAKLMKDPDADEELVKSLRPKERQLFNVIDLDDKEQKIKIWEISNFLFGEFLEEEIRNGDEENASFFFYEGGKSLKVRFKQESFGENTFLKTHRVDFEDRDDYGADILKETVDLDKVLIVLSYEELEKKFLGMEHDEATQASAVEEDEKPKEEAPPARRRKPAVKEESQDDDLPMEDEKPAEENPVSVRRRKPVVEEEPAEEAPDEPEEKPSKPAGKSSGSKCPAGGEFGKDCNQLKECDKCDIWDSCQDKRDEMDAERRKARKA